MATGDSGEGLQPHRQILANFARLEPGQPVRLEAVSGGDYYTRLLTQIASGDPPDLLQIGDDALGLFVRRGVLEPLDESLLPPANLWVHGVLQPGRWNGRQYLLPKDFTPLAVYCNRRIFRQAGLETPGPNWTWDEFVGTARRLRTTVDWGVVWPGPHSGVLECLVAMEGGRLTQPNGSYLGALDSAAVVRALERLHGLYYGPSAVAPLPLDLGSFDGGNLDFEQGRAAMKVGGRWPLPVLRQQAELELLIVPMPRAAHPANVLFWAGLGVAAGSQHKAMASKLLQAYCGAQGAEVWRQWGLPAVRSVVDQSHLEDDPLERVWFEELDHLAPRAYSYDPYWSQIGQAAMNRLSEAAVVLADPDLARLARQEARRAEAERLRRLAEDT